MPDIETILANAGPGEDGLLEIATESAQAIVEILDAEACEIWIWRRGDGGEPALLRLGAFGPQIPEAISSELVRDLGDRSYEGFARSVAADDAAHARVLQVAVGLHGHIVVSRGSAPASEAMLAWLHRMAGELAAAVALRLPHEELVEMNRWLIRRNEVDRTVARSFAKVRKLDELGRTIEQVADELFAVEYSGIYFLDPDTGKLRLVHAKGLTEEERRRAEATAESRHPGFVLRTGRVVDVPDMTKESIGGEEPPSHGKLILSRMYLPVRVDGVVVGTVGFASTKRASYSVRHRQTLSFLADFAGLTYARIMLAHENERRGALLLASQAASERLLVASDWRIGATSALAMVGSAIDAGTLALLEVRPTEGDHNGPRPIEFTWQPVFGEPWLHGQRLAGLTQPEREALAAGEAVQVSFEDMKEPAMLKPVIVEGALWGVLAYEARSTRHRSLDVGERVALRALANAFSGAIARERTDELLRQRQKMEAVGMLAAGLARDLNNMLWPIVLYTEMLERSLPLDGRMRQMLGDIRKSSRGATELVQQVLAIAQRRERLVELVPVEGAVRAAASLLSRSAPATVDLQVVIEPGVGEVFGDADSIQQAIMNLGAFAFDGLKGQRGTVRIEAVRLMRGNRRYARIVVSDDGPGIEPERRARLFDPYFPRRDAADSGGKPDLGLSVVHRIVTELDGVIAVQSEPARGTRFEILIPAAKGSAAAEAMVSRTESGGASTGERGEEAKPEAASSAPTPQRGTYDAYPGEVVLVVDDDAAVLEVERQMLECLGYGVIAHARPHDALAVLADERAAVSLLLTDLTMPTMNGIDLARESRARRPNMPIVCCTGHGDDIAERRALEAGMSAFVRKPIDLDALARTLRSSIDDARSRDASTAPTTSPTTASVSSDRAAGPSQPGTRAR